MIATTPDIDPDGRYTLSQAAELLQVHRSTLWRYVKSGRLKLDVTMKSINAKYKGRDLLQLWRTI